MNLNIKHIILLFITVACTMQVKAQTTVEQHLDSVEILIGQQTDMTINVTTKKSAHVQFPPFTCAQYIVPGVEIVSISAADTTALDNEFVKVTKRYTLTSFDEHLYAIPGQKVKVNGKPYIGNTIALKVVTMDVDTLHPNQFFPPKDVQDNPFAWSEWSTVFWLSVIMIILCLLAFYLYLRLRNGKPIITHIRIIKRIPAHQKALTAIDKLKTEKMVSAADQKTYYTQLTDTLRLYIEERFGFSAMEMTTSQIIFNLCEKGDKKMIDELKNLFETADLVKFAKYETLINENDMNLVNAINFIDQTKQEGEPLEERIVPKLNEKDKHIQQNRIVIKILLSIISISITILLIYIIYQVYLLLV